MNNSPESILIAGGVVVDPSQEVHDRLDILVERGRITQVARSIPKTRSERVIDAAGLHVVPGFVDLHTHLRDPGGAGSETIESGTEAAAAGGFTTVFAMPNTNPICDSPVVVRYVLDRAAQLGRVRVVPVAAVTRGQSGEFLADLGALKQAGAMAFSDDGRPLGNAQVMRRALQYTQTLGVPIFDHCEDLSLTGDGIMHEGEVALRLGLRGIPRSSEATAVARDAALALETGGRLHVCHVSNRDSVAVIREFKARGAPITAEVTPHHLTLTDAAVAEGEGYRTSAKMKPPLCEESDRRALIEAVGDGTIDCIATDHAPHCPASKDTLFDAAPFGIIGFESAFSVLYTAFVAPGVWTLDFLVRRLTIDPARVVGADWGTLHPGATADIALLQLGRDSTFDERSLRSRSRNSPWLGKRFAGKVVGTLAGGADAFADQVIFPRGLFEKRSD